MGDRGWWSALGGLAQLEPLPQISLGNILGSGSQTLNVPIVLQPALGAQNRGGVCTWGLPLASSPLTPEAEAVLPAPSIGSASPLPLPPAHEGATCDLLGKIYHNGESFQPTCKLQCICMDGAIGCIPLCSDDLRLPSPECPNPRRVKFRNKCCEEWVCEEGSEENRFETAMAGERWAGATGAGAVCWGVEAGKVLRGAVRWQD